MTDKPTTPPEPRPPCKHEWGVWVAGLATGYVDPSRCRVCGATQTPPEPVEARDLTAEEEAKARTYLRRAPGTENVEAWRRWASNLTWAVPLYADKMWATIDALRADTARVPEGLDGFTPQKVAEYAVWYARKKKGPAAEVAAALLEEFPWLREPLERALTSPEGGSDD